MVSKYSGYSFYRELIEEVNQSWKTIIIHYLEKLYENVWLPSHDIGHHLRVWENAIIISEKIEKTGLFTEKKFFEELIICCLFHDTGLIVDAGEQHGAASRAIARKFLQANVSKVSFDINPLLDAIENHDDKNYSKRNDEVNLLLEILSVADDMDAMGALGLYRYIEIYLMRGNDPKNIPWQIQMNVEKRYDYLQQCLLKYKIPDEVLKEKYYDLQNLIMADNFVDDPVTLVRWILEEIVEPKRSPLLTISQLKESEQDNKRLLFFAEKFIKEYQSFTYHI